MAGLMEALQVNRPLLADGATGTMLQTMGLPVGEPPERWTLDNPDAVKNLARLYAEAGSNIIYTNTFGANRIRLHRFGLAGKVSQLNRLAVTLALEGSQSFQNSSHDTVPIFIVASVGPTGELLAPYGDLTLELAYDVFSEQVSALNEAGADAIACETFSDLNEALVCLKSVQSITKLPALVSMSFEETGRTMMGVTAEDAIRKLLDAGASVVGANCSVGPHIVERVIKTMKAFAPEGLLLAKPNAGKPQWLGEKVVYPITPKEMATFAIRMREIGVAIVGGCCGTTPEHISAMSKALAN